MCMVCIYIIYILSCGGARMHLDMNVEIKRRLGKASSPLHHMDRMDPRN